MKNIFSLSTRKPSHIYTVLVLKNLALKNLKKFWDCSLSSKDGDTSKLHLNIKFVHETTVWLIFQFSLYFHGWGFVAGWMVELNKYWGCASVMQTAAHTAPVSTQEGWGAMGWCIFSGNPGSWVEFVPLNNFVWVSYLSKYEWLSIALLFCFHFSGV